MNKNPRPSGKEERARKSSDKGNRTLPRIGIFAVVGAVVLWSSSYVVTKVGVGNVPPLTFAAIRFGFAGLLMGALALTLRRLEPVPLKDLPRLALGGLLGVTAYYALQNMGVQRTSAADATLLVASFPVITLLLEIIFFKARVNIKQISGIAIAFAGVYLIIDLSGAQNAPDVLEGNLLLLGTGISWALYNFATHKVVQKYPTFTVIFWQMLFGLIALLPLAFLEVRSWKTIDVNGVMGALFLGVFCSVGAYLLYGYGLKTLRPGLAVNLMNLVPVFGLIFATFFLNERIGIVQLFGGTIVIGGVTLSISTVSRSRENSTSEKTEEGQK